MDNQVDSIYYHSQPPFCCLNIPKSWFNREQCNKEVTCFKYNYCGCMHDRCCIYRVCNTASYSLSHWFSWIKTNYPNIAINTNNECDVCCSVICAPVKLPYMILCFPCCCYKDCN